MHQAIVSLREQGVLLFGSVIWSLVACCEREAGQFDSALASLNCSLAESEGNAHRWFDAEILTLRGEVLHERDGADSGLAEQAYLAAIAVAQAQSARSFELRARLGLAKLYRASGREAEAVLASALEGISPSPEFPEVLGVVALTKPV